MMPPVLPGVEDPGLAERTLQAESSKERISGACRMVPKCRVGSQASQLSSERGIPSRSNLVSSGLAKATCSQYGHSTQDLEQIACMMAWDENDENCHPVQCWVMIYGQQSLLNAGVHKFRGVAGGRCSGSLDPL